MSWRKGTGGIGWQRPRFYLPPTSFLCPLSPDLGNVPGGSRRTPVTDTGGGRRNVPSPAKERQSSDKRRDQEEEEVVCSGPAAEGSSRVDHGLRVGNWRELKAGGGGRGGAWFGR